MKEIITWRSALICGVLVVCGVLTGNAAAGQTGIAKAERPTASALLLSDIHFDPFHDPGKAARLAEAPVSQWRDILAAPASPEQAAAFASLQRQCNARGVDTSYELFRSSLHAERREAADVKFITVSGDLIAHGFSCRYAALIPGKSQSDYAAFVAKTVEYVIGELRGSFPDVPVYMALGNNDSACGDYQLDGGSDFLTTVGKNVVAGLPKSANHERALADFQTDGDYSVMMAAPMQNTRLLVLDDIFMSNKYATCRGTQDIAAATAQIAWLRKEFAEARQQKQKVWLMGHIPPGVDVYATFSKMRNVCGGDKAATFLASPQLGDVLVENADVIRLGLFAHTHMDELRLLTPEKGAKGGEVAIKMVPSISPVDGNNPSFTVAQIDPASATLVDYEVVAAADHTGTSWSKEYDYAQTYDQPSFSTATLEKLLDGFRADPDAKTDASRAYISNFLVGDRSSLIKPLWPQYVCALSHYKAEGFAGCVCGASR